MNMDLSKIELFTILNFIKKHFTYEDICFLALIIIFIIEKKCDKLFIALLVFIFFAGLKKDIFSSFFTKAKEQFGDIGFADYMNL